MSNEYRIEPAGGAFKVIGPYGGTVDTYPNEEAARQDIERCKTRRRSVRNRWTSLSKRTRRSLGLTARRRSIGLAVQRVGEGRTNCDARPKL